MEEEIWKPIPEHRGYEASSFGRVRSTPLRSKDQEYYILSQNYTRGYLGCQLGYGRYRVNRIICATFHGLPPSLDHEAAHLDNNKENNKPENLAWKTSAENKADQPDKQKGINNPRAILIEADVIKIRKMKDDGFSIDGINIHFKQVSRSTIAYICQRKTWKHVP